MRERLRKQPVGEPRVARQERAVQIRPDRATEAAALVARLAVVPEAGDDAAERLGAGVELCAARMILEAGDPPDDVALEEHVADHPRLAGDRLERQQSHAGHVLAGKALVAAA